MKRTVAKIIANRQTARDIFELIIELPEEVKTEPGQFAMLSAGTREGIYLKRPLSVHDCEGKRVTFLYAQKGKGTKELSTFSQGEIEVILPLGKGFPTIERGAKVALLGGGIGIFPLYMLFRAYPDAKYYSYLGYRCADSVCLTDKFRERSAHTVIATDDGSYGKRGVITALLAKEIKALAPDIILACGPLPMLKALKALNSGIPTYVSMEERMACGFGACLVCACASRGSYVRTCTEGPVFDINEVDL
ncbi:MAG: dihydroorotate dehydrogenase electron transfer subunit [Christensenellales bacterium]|jgi:dihydroorotate dehydrogenase electron transfer subunit